MSSGVLKHSLDDAELLGIFDTTVNGIFKKSHFLFAAFITSLSKALLG